ncbi:MAG: DUF4375 domain-containing protein [Bacteroidia bacterium]|nr:DUF4375 domain-containing protein [Bacteroidia bacterium]
MDTRIRISLDEFKTFTTTEHKYPLSDYFDKFVDHLANDILNINTGAEFYKKLTRGQRILWSYSNLTGQIENGGINQFYWNYGSDYFEDVKDVMSIIKDTKFTSLIFKYQEKFLKSKELLINYKYLDKKEPELKLGQYDPNAEYVNYYGLWSNTFGGNDLDSYYYSNSKTLDQFIIDYINNNPEEFIK